MSFSLVTLYSAFACLATAANIFSQYITILSYQGQYALTISIIIGTLIGLYIKFLLDKKYIFHDASESIKHHGKTFILYSVMGVFTTAIYLFVELMFDSLFDSLIMRYVGAVLGLAMGYWVKYRLDKKYVFKTNAEITVAPSGELK